MATVAVAAFDRGVSVGRVFERAFATIRHNPVTTIGSALLLAGVPTTAFDLLMSNVRPEFLVLTFVGYALPGSIALFLIGWFVSQILGTFTQGAMVTAVVAENESRRAGLSETLIGALRSFIPLLGLGVLVGLAVVMGTTLLIVPAVMVYILWSVAPSAVTQEGEGLFMAINRSQELGEGARWKAFGILSILFVIGMVLSLSVTLLGRLAGLNLRTPQLSASFMFTVATVATITNLLWSTALASLYVELREWKEGGSVDTLEQVFI